MANAVTVAQLGDSIAVTQLTCNPRPCRSWSFPQPIAECREEKIVPKGDTNSWFSDRYFPFSLAGGNPIQTEVTIMASAPKPVKNDSTETGAFRCTVCNAIFESSGELREHRDSTGHLTSSAPEQTQRQQQNRSDQQKSSSQPVTPSQTDEDDDSSMEDEGGKNHQSR